MLNPRTARLQIFVCGFVLFPVVGWVACSPAHGQIPPFASESTSPAAQGGAWTLCSST